MSAAEWLTVIGMIGAFVAWMTGTFWKLGAIAQNTKHLAERTESIDGRLDGVYQKLDGHSDKFDEHAKDINNLRMDVLKLESSVLSSWLRHHAATEASPE